jgi:hypothetical protein
MKQTPITRKTPLKAKKAIQATHELAPRRISRKARQDQVAPKKRKRPMPKRAETRMKHRPTATPAERAHMDKVARLACVCCRKAGQVPRPTDLHHIRAGYGRGQRASNWEVLPLDEPHHQGKRAPVDKAKLAFHEARKTWERTFGTEVELLLEVWAELGLDIEDLPRLRGSEPPWWQAYKEGRHTLPPIPEDARRVLLSPPEHP